jgi:hypothetical protein
VTIENPLAISEEQEPGAANGNETQVKAKTEPTPDDVAQRAYELYEARGGQPGAELDDWVRAERERRESSDGTDNEAV